MGLKFKKFRAKFTLKPKKKEPEIVCLGYRVYNPNEDIFSESREKVIPTPKSFQKGISNKSAQNETLQKENNAALTSQTTKTDANESIPTNYDNKQTNEIRGNEQVIANYTSNGANAIELYKNDEHSNRSTLIFMTEDNEDVHFYDDDDENDIHDVTKHEPSEVPPHYSIETHPYRQSCIDEQETKEEDDGNFEFIIRNNQYSEQATSIFFGGEEPTLSNRKRNFTLNDKDDSVSESSQTSA